MERGVSHGGRSLAVRRYCSGRPPQIIASRSLTIFSSTRDNIVLSASERTEHSRHLQHLSTVAHGHPRPATTTDTGTTKLLLGLLNHQHHRHHHHRHHQGDLALLRSLPGQQQGLQHPQPGVVAVTVAVVVVASAHRQHHHLLPLLPTTTHHPHNHQHHNTHSTPKHPIPNIKTSTNTVFTIEPPERDFPETVLDSEWLPVVDFSVLLGKVWAFQAHPVRTTSGPFQLLKHSIWQQAVLSLPLLTDINWSEEKNKEEETPPSLVNPTTPKNTDTNRDIPKEYSTTQKTTITKGNTLVATPLSLREQHLPKEPFNHHQPQPLYSCWSVQVLLVDHCLQIDLRWTLLGGARWAGPIQSTTCSAWSSTRVINGTDLLSRVSTGITDSEINLTTITTTTTSTTTTRAIPASTNAATTATYPTTAAVEVLCCCVKLLLGLAQLQIALAVAYYNNLACQSTKKEELYLALTANSNNNNTTKKKANTTQTLINISNSNITATFFPLSNNLRATPIYNCGCGLLPWAEALA